MLVCFNIFVNFPYKTLVVISPTGLIVTCTIYVFQYNTQDSATFPVCSFIIIFKTEIIKYNRRCPCLQWNKIINFLCTLASKAERNKSHDMLKNSKSTSITHLELHHFTRFPVTGEFFKAAV